MNGTFCYAHSYQEFITNCRDPGLAQHNITDNWIVANPFNRTFSNEMITNATNYTDSRITGLIFVSDSDITAQRRYENPQLISRIATKYSW